MEYQDLLYRKAEIKDVEQIAKLVSGTIGTCNLQKNHSIIENNIAEITDSISNYFVCEYQNNIIGVCGIEHQRKGIGIKLLFLCINNETCDILYKVGAIMDNILIQNFCWRS